MPLFTFEPIMTNRFAVTIPRVLSSVFFCKGAQLPTVTNEEVLVHQKMASFKSKGKTQYQDIQLTFYDSVLGAASRLINLWQKQHHDVNTGMDNYQDAYMETIFIASLDPKNIPVQIWKLHDVFIGEINYGDHDWSQGEAKTFTVTLKYSYCNLVF